MSFDPTAGLASAIAQRCERDSFKSPDAMRRYIAARADIHDALYEAHRYFTDRQDADCDESGYIPNTEMGLATKLAAAMDAAGLDHD